MMKKSEVGFGGVEAQLQQRHNADVSNAISAI